MKTITEFHVATLKNAHKTKADLLASGKTAEELPAALGEALKLEGDKLTNMIAAIELVETDTKSKTLDLKRVLVSKLNENEAAPKTGIQKGDFYFTIEYFPPLPGQEKKQARGGRDGERGGKGRDGKRGDRKGKGRGPKGGRDAAAGGGGGDRGPRRDAGAPRPEGAPGEARAPRPPRQPRPQRPRIPIVPPVNDGQPRFKVIVKSAGETPAAGANTPAPAAATDAPKNETT